MVGCGASNTATVDDTGSTVGEATVASVATTVESTTTTSESVPSDDTTRTTEAAAPPDESTTTLPPGATPGLDDFDGNGEPDPTCGTQDFGAGLVLRIPCEIRSANDPENGTSLVAGSLYRLPGTDFPEFDNVSASAIQARDADGGKVVVIFFNSDALFTINSAELGGDATTVSLNAAVAVVQNHFPNADVQVRGHTDAQGSAASNQKLSEQRAAAVK
jgi:outer membrane protein OmpA-like peptidoglycan-associated protein